MISSNQLSLLEAMKDGDIDRLEPTFDDAERRVIYPQARSVLDSTTAVDETLSTLLDRSILAVERQRDCTCVLSEPHETMEFQLPTYELTAEGERWAERHVDARHATEDLLEQRGFAVTTDATVVGDSDSTYTVHMQARDDLLGVELIVGLTDDPTDDDIRKMDTIADDVGCRGLLVTTTEASDDVHDTAVRHGVSFLFVEGDVLDEDDTESDEETVDVEA